MLFHEVRLSRDQILQGIADALQSPDALVFLDTSLLLHVYDVGAGARDELIAALESLGEKVKVPMWAARETWERSYDETLGKTPLKQPAGKLETQLKTFVTDVRRFIDEETISQAEAMTKAEYQGKLETAQDELLQLVRLASRHARNPDETSGLLLPFLNARLLDSDLSRVLERVSKEAEFRFAHKMPPGWRDGGATDATGKKENRFGDVIIWFEILATIGRDRPQHVVVITRDVKDDTVYKPKRLLDAAGNLAPNLTVTLPHPMMTHEAKQACDTLATLNMVSLDAFAQVLNNNLGIAVPKLLAALQSGQDTGRNVVRAAQGAPPAADAAEVGDEAVTFTPDDLNYEPKRDNALDQVMMALAVPDFRVQNDAVALLSETLQTTTTRAQQIHLGRVLARAAVAGAREPSDFLVDVLADQAAPADLRRHLLIGALAGVYLSATAELRKPLADPLVTEALFRLRNDQVLHPAYVAILSRLAPQRQAYLALPTDDIDAIPLELLVEREAGGEPTLRGVMSGAAELLDETAPTSRRLGTLGEEITLDQLLDRIAVEFCVPRSFLTTDQTSPRFLIAPTLGFILWGPFSGVDLR